MTAFQRKQRVRLLRESRDNQARFVGKLGTIVFVRNDEGVALVAFDEVTGAMLVEVDTQDLENADGANTR